MREVHIDENHCRFALPARCGGGVRAEVATDDIVTKRLVGYLPEHNPLYLDMYVTEYLNFVAGFYAIDTNAAALPK